MEGQVVAALKKDGYRVFEHVGISTTTNGKTTVAVADYAVRKGDQIIFGEVKAGLQSKLSFNQKVVYSAIKAGNIKILNPSYAEGLGVLANKALGEGAADVALHALENGRAWRQFARYIPGAARTSLKVLGSAPVEGAMLFLSMDEPSAYDSLMDQCPRCRSQTFYDVRQSGH
jgi:hypothetical protein